MNNNRISEFIKKIRKDNNLTQKDLADKYNVTYQAVSKWENGKNLPDIELLKQMSKDYNVSLDDLLDGHFRRGNKYLIFIVVLLLIGFLITGTIIFMNRNKDENIKLEEITTMCQDFTVKGTIAYNNNNMSLQISDINYCGDDFKDKYTDFECILYESGETQDTKIAHFEYKDETTLEDFLSKVSFKVDNYKKTCNILKDNTLYIKIKAKTNRGVDITHEIPLTFEDNC